MNVDLPNKTNDLPLYQQVADRLRQLMTEGTLQPGDRLPSVRKLHGQLSVSISTILEAYRVLEDQGWVQARSQSGYYVKSMPQPIRAEPQQSMLLAQDQPIEVSLAYRVYASKRDPNLLQIGTAVPSPDLFPLAALNRLMGQVTRSQPQEVIHGYDVPAGCLTLRHGTRSGGLA
jgi:DNA-binding transcriptional MocR family regulator